MRIEPSKASVIHVRIHTLLILYYLCRLSVTRLTLSSMIRQLQGIASDLQILTILIVTLTQLKCMCMRFTVNGSVDDDYNDNDSFLGERKNVLVVYGTEESQRERISTVPKCFHCERIQDA